MAYRAYGVIIEGIGVGNSGGDCWLGGWHVAASTLGVGGRTCAVRRDALAAAPQLSATELDPLTGELRSGSVQITLHATASVTASLLAQAIARRPTTVLQADLTATATSAAFAPAPPTIPGGLLHLGEELVSVDADLGGGSYTITRARAGTQASGHTAGLNAYTAPPWWVGRSVTLVTLELAEDGALIGSPRVVWQGYLVAAPEASRSTTTIQLRAEDALATLRRVGVNRGATPYNEASPLPVQGTTSGLTVFGELVPRDSIPRVRKLDQWATDGLWRAMQLGPSLVLTAQDVTPTGQPELGSPRPSDPDAPIDGPYWELAVWSSQLDAKILAEYGDPGISPTLGCDYPYHPLTIAAALLGSSTDRDVEDPLIYDVLQPEWSAGVGYLLDSSTFTQMIERTSYIEVDQLVLGWDGKRTPLYELVTQQLLPAYGFALTVGPGGLLRPIQIGPADVLDFASAAQVAPLPESWAWESGIGGALDALTAIIGELPWREGREIVVTGQGVRVQAGGRATRLVTPRSAEAQYPSLSPTAAEGYGATELVARLIWRYDGLPVVRCQLPEGAQPYWVGQWVRLLKPDGLLTPILFDRDGARVDAWDTQPYLGQITSLRYDVQRARYDAELLLANYALGRAAKWRAPSARIKGVGTVGLYKVEGLVSDLDALTSDALAFTVGDEARWADPALGSFSEPRIVFSLSATGDDWWVEIKPDFTTRPAAGDWIQLGQSADYSNAAVVGASEPYPYAFMTDAATLDRPGATTSDPDEFA
jgi:hypothetical protein